MKTQKNTKKQPIHTIIILTIIITILTITTQQVHAEFSLNTFIKELFSTDFSYYYGYPKGSTEAMNMMYTKEPELYKKYYDEAKTKGSVYIGNGVTLTISQFPINPYATTQINTMQSVDLYGEICLIDSDCTITGAKCVNFICDNTILSYSGTGNPDLVNPNNNNGELQKVTDTTSLNNIFTWLNEQPKPEIITPPSCSAGSTPYVCEGLTINNGEKYSITFCQGTLAENMLACQKLKTNNNGYLCKTETTLENGQKAIQHTYTTSAFTCFTNNFKLDFLGIIFLILVALFTLAIINKRIFLALFISFLIGIIYLIKTGINLLT